MQRRRISYPTCEITGVGLMNSELDLSHSRLRNSLF